MNKLKAMVLYEFNKDMIFEEVEPPKLEADELLLKVKACGICYTDVKIISGLIPVINLPHILGHEIAGKVVEIGDKVKDIKVGDKGIVYFYIPCRDCEMCRNARENICYSIKRLGFELPGGYAQYVKVPAYNFCPFNKEISFEEMAILPDAVATPYHALKQMADLKADQNVLVIGIGGLGIHAIQIAFMMGSRVIAADIRDEALEVAKRYGAELLINPLKEDPKKMIRDWTEGKGIDVIIEGVGTPDSFKWALQNYGPMSVYLLVPDDWYFYKSGVYEPISIPINYSAGHAVVLCGWNDYDDCWIIKNSWSERWGEDGYARVKYGNLEKYNYDFAIIVEPCSTPSCNFEILN